MRLNPQDYQVPQYVAIAVSENGDKRTFNFLPETEQRLFGNKHEIVDVAREKMLEWVRVRAEVYGDKVFIYTLNTTVEKTIETVWSGKISATDPMRTDLN